MKVLGLEASGTVAGVAVLEDDKILAEYTINHKKTHSKTLMPMIEEIKNRFDIDISTVDAIAVNKGPGSYTGLRIGSATAKGLGMAYDLPIVSVPTMESMAYNLWGAEGYVCPMIDARRNRVYTGIYYFSDGEIITHTDQDVVDVDDLLDSICEMLEDEEKLYDNIIFFGDGVLIYRERIVERLGKKAKFAPAHMNRQKASSVASLGLKYLERGETETASEHRPLYLMLSQAEKERLDEGKSLVEPSDTTHRI